MEGAGFFGSQLSAFGRSSASRAKLQMIRGDGNFSSETASFVKEIKNYTVISIIGPQSSGKSYLLNNLFEAEFDVLNAAEGRKQTTKGVWIARFADPGMIIMDVEGFDGKERGEDDTLFERQSALFSLIVSDVLLLNMWFHNIGHQKGANLDLIELIFEERVKIEATKTTIIIVVRDNEYDTPSNVTRKQLETTLNEIWQKVHPPGRNKKMSDYIEVSVKDFPSLKFQKKEFDQKCKDLSKYLCNFAANENIEQTQYGSGFAISSEQIWDCIRSNKEIIAADHKIAKSKYVCKKIIRKMLGSLDQEGHWMIDSTIHVKKFTAEFSLVHKNILTRYEEQTASVIRTVRNEKKAKLEKQLLDRFEKGLFDRMHEITNKILSSAKANLHVVLQKFPVLDNSAIIEVTKQYRNEFEYNTPAAADLQWYPYPDCKVELEKIGMKFFTDLTKQAEEEAYNIQVERSICVCKNIMKEMLGSFDQEKAHWMVDLYITVKKFTEEFSLFHKNILTRYDEMTTSIISSIRNEERTELEKQLRDRYQKGLYHRMQYLASNTLSWGKSNLRSVLEMSEEVGDSAILEAISPYLKIFDENTPSTADLQWYSHQDCAVELTKIRMKFVTDITKHAEKEANDIQIYRSMRVCKKIAKELQASFDQDAHWMTDVSIPVKQFTEKFSFLHEHILTRYEEKTASCNSAVRNAEKAELEMTLLDRFPRGFVDRLSDLASKTLNLAKSNLKSELKKLENLNESALIKVLKSYLQIFDDNTPTAEDLQWYPYEKYQLDWELGDIRDEFITDLTEIGEKKANKIESKRARASGIKAIVKIIIGTAWAIASGKTSILASGLAALALSKQPKLLTANTSMKKIEFSS